MPVKLSPEVHARRLELYSQGYSDAQMTEATGVGRRAIQSWRLKNHLPAHAWYVPREAIIQTTRARGPIPMEAALDPDQCEVVSGFLRALICMANQRPGKPVDVGGFMSEYRKGGAAYVEQIQR